jgi:hypothetical protein
MLVPGENFEIRTHLPSLVHLLTIISLEVSFFLSATCFSFYFANASYVKIPRKDPAY